MASCYKCQVELTDDNWYPSCRTRRKYLCKSCHRAYHKAYKRARSEAGKAYQRKYYWNNREAILAKLAVDRECGRANARAQGWRDANREHYREYQREYQRKLRAKRRGEPVIEFITPTLEPMVVENIGGIEVRRYD